MNTWEQKIAYHCAPVLAGVKAANLVMFSCAECREMWHSLNAYRAELATRGILIRVFSSAGRAMIFVYRPKLLETHLEPTAVQDFLARHGYERDMTLTQALNTLAKRIVTSADFPHEIGIFLGYPLSDVEGFLDRRGKGFLLCGEWKVYSEADKAARLFALYRDCRTRALGKTIREMVS